LNNCRFSRSNGPTSPIVDPASIVALKFFKTGTSKLLGYLKQTFSNVISPLIYSFLIIVVPGSLS